MNKFANKATENLISDLRIAFPKDIAEALVEILNDAIGSQDWYVEGNYMIGVNDTLDKILVALDGRRLVVEA